MFFIFQVFLSLAEQVFNVHFYMCVHELFSYIKSTPC